MNKAVAGLVFIVCLALPDVTSFAQGGNGRGACMDKYYISYYKIVPGKYDEWLLLFRKWHLPIISHDVDQGLFEYKFFGAGSHAVSPDWDFATMYIEPVAPKKSSISRAQLIEKLFGDNMDEYIAGEKRRWELTSSHWDETLIQMDPLQEPFSVFLPISSECKKQ